MENALQKIGVFACFVRLARWQGKLLSSIVLTAMLQIKAFFGPTLQKHVLANFNLILRAKPRQDHVKIASIAFLLETMANTVKTCQNPGKPRCSSYKPWQKRCFLNSIPWHKTPPYLPASMLPRNVPQRERPQAQNRPEPHNHRRRPTKGLSVKRGVRVEKICFSFHVCWQSVLKFERSNRFSHLLIGLLIQGSITM